MNNFADHEIRAIIEAVHYRPAISILLPFEHKTGLKSSLAYSLKTITDKVEQELINNYPGELVNVVLHKLKTIISNLKPDTNKKSIAIYVSPVFEKVVYLDIAVEEKIIIDESFEIRDLVYSKKILQEYLVLLLGGNECQLFLGKLNSLTNLPFNPPVNLHSLEDDIPQKVANFSDMSERREILMHKYLHHLDHSLGPVLKQYNLPLFVLGTERISGHFKSLTKYPGAIAAFIHGNYDEAGVPQLQEVMKPYLENWEKVKQKNLLHLAEKAADNKKLVSGINEVWHAAMNKKGRLLLVEKNYTYEAQQGSRKEIIYNADQPNNSFSSIKDAVDDVIEKILETGGDVEFMDEGMLKDYQHITLIQYY